MTTNISKQLFYDPTEQNQSEPRIYKSYVIVGNVLLRQVKITEVGCPMFTKNKAPCTHPFYTKSVRKEDKGENFETEETTKISGTIDGEFGSYDGSGYLQKFDPYYNSSLANESAFIFYLLFSKIKLGEMCF